MSKKKWRKLAKEWKRVAAQQVEVGEAIMQDLNEAVKHLRAVLQDLDPKEIGGFKKGVQPAIKWLSGYTVKTMCREPVEFTMMDLPMMDILP